MSSQLVPVAAVVLVATGIKVLLIPAYRSTDFEVHRNWMAITHSLPLSQWYVDATSQWTLDYPPFFAWWEWLLAKVANVVDPAMLELSAEPVESAAVVSFQRTSVIVSELVLLWAAFAAVRSLERGKSISKAATFKLPPPVAALLLLAFHPGLLIVDHIHFQYNGLLLGVLVLSAFAAARGSMLLSAALFTALVCSKHLFLVAGPAYAAFLLAWACGRVRSGAQAEKERRRPSVPSQNRPTVFAWSIFARRMASVGTIVVALLTLALGPFALTKQLAPLFQRLFPFQRGLLHAYWAPNAWALYAAADRVLVALSSRWKLGWLAPGDALPSFTGGLVQVSSFAVLPQIEPSTTALLTLAALFPALLAAWRRPHQRSFPLLISYSLLTGFVLGYHVHEKAILATIVPLAVHACASRAPEDAGRYFFLSTTGTVSLFPLLFAGPEYGIKVVATALYAAAAWVVLSTQASVRGEAGRTKAKRQPPLLTRWQVVYLAGLGVVELASSWLVPASVADRLPFLPLATMSCYCALGIVYTWLQMAVTLLWL